MGERLRRAAPRGSHPAWEAIKQFGHDSAGRLGYEIHRSDRVHAGRRATAMALRQIDLVLDVGANQGQYVSWLRRAGYTGRVASFEPLPGAFSELTRRHGADPRWTGMNVAVGAQAGQVQVYEMATSTLSSVLPGREGLDYLTGSEVVRSHDVTLVALDDEWEPVVGSARRVMLKVDTQGYEHAVLDGVARHLADVELIEIEMALTAMYEGGSSIHDLLPRLKQVGFDVISLEPGDAEFATGQVSDVDVLLGRVPNRT